MSDVGEHSDSEFYYPDDLSDTEVLQQPTSLKKSQNYSQTKKFIILLEATNKQAPSRKRFMTSTYSKNFLMNVLRNEESIKLPRPSSTVFCAISTLLVRIKRTTQLTNLIQCHPSHEASSATWKTAKQR